MPLKLRPIVHAILDEFALDWDGDHGVFHWARVLENGVRLAEQTGANVEVVQLFALFHDSRRVRESGDCDHGQRGAEFATELRGKLFDLSDDDLHLLYEACAGHSDEWDHHHITIQTCFDADRLDLGRVGITPHPSGLCTEAARRPSMIKWADGRASFDFVPKLVKDEWGIE